MRRSAVVAMLVLGLGAGGGCSDPDLAHVDPAVLERPLPALEAPIDTALLRAGGFYFRKRCVACHGSGEGISVGPDLRGVTQRRDTAWLRGMVLRPDSMIAADSVARRLFDAFGVPMLDTQTSELEFRALYELLRASDLQSEAPTPPP